MKTTKNISQLSYGFANSPFGLCCVAFSGREIYALLFPTPNEDALADLKSRFPKTDFTQDNVSAEKLAAQVFEKNEKPELTPLGTDFQQLVWKALQQIPAGTTTTYAKIAAAIGRPKAVRAVGTAIGANPIAYLIPCHRVLRTDGGMGGFRWGLECKKKMLDWERR